MPENDRTREFVRLPKNSVKLNCISCGAAFESMMTVQQGPIVMFGCPACHVCLGVQVVQGKLTDYRPVGVDGETCVDVPLSGPEMLMFFHALMRDDTVMMDEVKSAPLAKMRNGLQVLGVEV